MQYSRHLPTIGSRGDRDIHAVTSSLAVLRWIVRFGTILFVAAMLLAALPPSRLPAWALEVRKPSVVAGLCAVFIAVAYAARLWLRRELGEHGFRGRRATIGMITLAVAALLAMVHGMPPVAAVCAAAFAWLLTMVLVTTEIADVAEAIVAPRSLVERLWRRVRDGATTLAVAAAAAVVLVGIQVVAHWLTRDGGGGMEAATFQRNAALALVKVVGLAAAACACIQFVVWGVLFDLMVWSDSRSVTHE